MKGANPMQLEQKINQYKVNVNPFEGSSGHVLSSTTGAVDAREARLLVVDAGLGLAPGSAFGDEVEGWLRWCFASRDPARLTQGVERLAGALRL